MKVYLVHHAAAFKAEQDPQRHISEKGRHEADRLGERWSALGVAPQRILHSEKQFTLDTAERIGAKLGASAKVAKAAYPISPSDPIEPFLKEIAAAGGDIMMCGHAEFLVRTISRLVCGDETKRVFDFKPGNGTAVCLEGKGDDWAISYAWRQEHAPG